MSDETNKAAELDAAIKDAKARKDAETAGNIDKILKGIDALTSACDALGKRMDAMEAGSKPKAEDDLPADPGARADALHQKHHALMERQAYADAVYSAFGDRAPPPLSGETVDGYRLRTATHLKQHSKTWKGVDLSKLIGNADAFDVAEKQIYADAAVAAANPGGLANGQLREVVKTDRAGHRISEFYGDAGHTFIRDLKSRPRRVARFLTPQSQA